jgi:hypothetical protein
MKSPRVAIKGLGCYHNALGSTWGGEERLQDSFNKPRGPIEGATPETAIGKKKKYRHRLLFLQIIIFHNLINIIFSFLFI